MSILNDALMGKFDKYENGSLNMAALDEVMQVPEFIPVADRLEFETHLAELHKLRAMEEDVSTYLANKDTMSQASKEIWNTRLEKHFADFSPEMKANKKGLLSGIRSAAGKIVQQLVKFFRKVMNGISIFFTGQGSKIAALQELAEEIEQFDDSVSFQATNNVNHYTYDKGRGILDLRSVMEVLGNWTIVETIYAEAQSAPSVAELLRRLFRDDVITTAFLYGDAGSDQGSAYVTIGTHKDGDVKHTFDWTMNSNNGVVRNVVPVREYESFSISPRQEIIEVLREAHSASESLSKVSYRTFEHQIENLGQAAGDSSVRAEDLKFLVDLNIAIINYYTMLVAQATELARLQLRASQGPSRDKKDKK